MKLNPKCFQNNHQLGHSAEGYLLPCCMSDHGVIPELWKDHLKIENNNNVEDIINSKEWKTFFEVLKDFPNDAPSICKKFCGKDEL